MRRLECLGNAPTRILVIILAALAVFVPVEAGCLESVDVVSGVLSAPQFKGKDPLQKLRMAADLTREKKVKQSDLPLAALDWADHFVREATDPLDRLKKWNALSNEEKLNPLRIPREFVNRILVAEYLVSETSYLKSQPKKKLQILERLVRKKLIDWSVALSYARLYAGAIVAGARTYEYVSPADGLKILKSLRDQGLIGWHYRVPTEAILVAEALAMDAEYEKASSYDRLLKLRALEQQGLISGLTRKDLERLPAWRLLINDSSFLAIEQGAKRKRISELKNEGLITEPTCTELTAIFRSTTLAPPPQEVAPAPLPKAKPSANK